MRIAFKNWFIHIETGEGSFASGLLRERADKVFELSQPEDRGEPVVMFVETGKGPELTGFLIAAKDRKTPGFTSGLLVAENSSTLFFGINDKVYVFDMQKPEILCEDDAEHGFWGWRQHGNIVLMSAECELAAFTENGRKLWTTFVEPPWSYDVDGATIILDVMGKISRFPLREGPPPPQRKAGLADKFRGLLRRD